MSYKFALLQHASAETASLAPDADTGLFQFAPDHNLGSHTNLQVGTNSQGTLGRGLFRFPIAGQIPRGARIDSVAVTNPAQPIFRIDPAGETRPFGTFTFERIE